MRVLCALHNKSQAIFLHRTIFEENTGEKMLIVVKLEWFMHQTQMVESARSTDC